jgi:hypothetical protein
MEWQRDNFDALFICSVFASLLALFFHTSTSQEAIVFSSLCGKRDLSSIGCSRPLSINRECYCLPFFVHIDVIGAGSVPWVLVFLFIPHSEGPSMRPLELPSLPAFFLSFFIPSLPNVWQPTSTQIALLLLHQYFCSTPLLVNSSLL